MVTGQNRFDPPIPVLLLAWAVICLGLWLRLIGTAWDGWAGLHPDERHMVYISTDILQSLQGGAAGDRGSLALWFAPESPFNPRATGRPYIYGELPVLAVTLFCRLSGIDGWGNVTQAGRLITAVVEASGGLAVFLITLSLLRRTRPASRHAAALMAALLYALAPMPLQLANFYTVDGWFAAFATWSLVPMLALAGQSRGGVAAALAAGVLVGLAGACKLPAIALIVPGLVAVALQARARGWWASLGLVALALLAGMLAFRLANPFAFSGPGFWGLQPSARLLQNLAEARSFAASPDMPPNWQWLAGYPIWALLRDLVLFGIGPAAVIGGVLALGRGRLPQEAGRGLIVLAAAALAHAALALALGPWVLRYFAPLVALAVVMAAVALTTAPQGVRLAVLALAVFWGAGSVALHSGAHPRVLASEWMRRLPAESRIGFETDWDEGLPLSRFVPSGVAGISQPGPFRFVALRLTDAEDPGTPARLAAALAQVDYLSISSGRQREVLPRLPERFAVATRYYAALESGRLCFARVFHADRGFPLPVLAFDDSFAQEPWRVYDHPVVSIWQKQPCFARLRVEDILAGR